jgi:hypothetical membrane protein
VGILTLLVFPRSLCKLFRPHQCERGLYSGMLPQHKVFRSTISDCCAYNHCQQLVTPRQELVVYALVMMNWTLLVSLMVMCCKNRKKKLHICFVDCLSIYWKKIKSLIFSLKMLVSPSHNELSKFVKKDLRVIPVFVVMRSRTCKKFRYVYGGLFYVISKVFLWMNSLWEAKTNWHNVVMLNFFWRNDDERHVTAKQRKITNTSLIF